MSTYEKLNCYKQPIYNIYGAYKRGSTDINMSIIEYLYTGIPITPELLYRIEQINNSFLNYYTYQKLNQKPNPAFTVYHGSDYELSGNFKALAFFSTTTDEAIARMYGQHVYEIILPTNFPYMHIRDNCNKQILLPIGTVFRTIKKGVLTVDGEQMSQTILNIIANTLSNKNMNHKIDPPITCTTNTKLTVNISQLQLAENKAKRKTKSSYSPYSISCPKFGTSGSSRSIEQYYYYNYNNLNASANFVKKDILKKTDAYKRSNIYVLARIMNEMLAGALYNIFRCTALEFKLICSGNEYFLGSTLEKTIQLSNLTSEIADNILSGFLVDCIMSNWDVGNNGNITGLEGNITGLEGNNIIRIDVGGALAYRGLGDFKLDFFRNNECREHKTFFTDQKNGSRKLFAKCIDILITNSKTPEQVIKTYIIDKLPQNINLINNPAITDIKNIFQKNNILTEFFDKIIDQVEKRYNYYKNHTSLVQEISKAYCECKKALQTPILCPDKLPNNKLPNNKVCLPGVGGSRKIIRKVHKDHIIVDKKKVYLNTIRGKYRYVKGGAPEAPDYNISELTNQESKTIEKYEDENDIFATENEFMKLLCLRKSKR